MALRSRLTAAEFGSEKLLELLRSVGNALRHPGLSRILA